MESEKDNIELYLTPHSRPFYTKVLQIVQELEALHNSKIYIYGSFVYRLVKHSYTEPDCVDLWLDTDKSVSHLKRVKINDVYFTFVNNENKPEYELYITTTGLLCTTSDESIQTVIDDIIHT